MGILLNAYGGKSIKITSNIQLMCLDSFPLELSLISCNYQCNPGDIIVCAIFFCRTEGGTPEIRERYAIGHHDVSQINMFSAYNVCTCTCTLQLVLEVGSKLCGHSIEFVCGE